MVGEGIILIGLHIHLRTRAFFIHPSQPPKTDGSNQGMVTLLMKPFVADGQQTSGKIFHAMGKVDDVLY
jgi:hypothetical protein